MRCRSRLIVSVLLVGFSSAGVAGLAQDQGQAAGSQQGENAGKEEKKKELTLERLFPEKSFFGPGAQSAEFSFDGRYAAYLYRPYIERRHGNDLWLYDSQTGEVKRLTSVSVLSEFQEDVRTVLKDREEKAKQAGIGQKKKEGAEEAKEEAEGAAGNEEKETSRATDAAVVNDPVTGTWEGMLTGGADLGIPPGGMPFKLLLQLNDEGAISGTLEVPMTKTTVKSGRFNAETGELTCSFLDEETGMAADLLATIDGDTMKGAITLTALGVTLELSGKRQAAETKTDETSEAQSTTATQEGNNTGDGTDATTQDQGDSETQQGKVEEKEIILGDWVGEKDADDEQAPRYRGVQSFVWSPVTQELIFTSGGDLYQFKVADGSIARLTRTQDNEQGVQYLPDGSGYAYMSNGAVMKVVFGRSFIEQLDPELPGGEGMIGFEISPDGTRLVFLTSKLLGQAPQRMVNIMTFRNRFAEVRAVPRHVSDDPLEKRETSIYLYDLRDVTTEKSKLAKVYTHNVTGPRDILQVPEWAPDSSRVGFAVYTQATGLVDVYEAAFPPREPVTDPAPEATEPAVTPEAAEGGESKEGEGDTKEEPKQPEEPEIGPARLVYRFYHNGGPNTPVMIHPEYLADSRRMVFLSEQSGFRHLHVLDPTYESCIPLTQGRFEVYPFGLSRDHKRMFVSATREHPSQEDIYVVDLENGNMTRLSRENGTYGGAAVSDDGLHALAMYNRYGTLRELTAIDAAKGEQKTLTDSHTDEARELTQPIPTFFTYANRHGHEIHGQMFKPDDWKPEDKRPLLIYVYGGPLGTRKMVVDGSYDTSAYFFAYYMAKKHGYITVTIDPRGASGYSGVFEKANYEQVGKPQVEDLVDGVRWLVANHGVDPKRVGIHGWSFGGFQTQMCMYTEPDVFACGIAGAGPTEWENYNSWYSQGTVGPTKEGDEALKQFSLLPLAKNLKGKLLLIHGMEDPNVLYQDTVRVYRELLLAGKETLVELFLDPTGGHGLGGDVKTLNRFRKYEEFLLRVLGSGVTPLAEMPAASEQTPPQG